MDILRKELNAVYASQCLDCEVLDSTVLADCRRAVEAMTGVSDACAVITDASCDRCYLYAGRFGTLMGINDGDRLSEILDSSDEDLIYNRLHPEDLVDKRMLEYEFFRYVDTLHTGEKTAWRATCRIRLRDRGGEYRVVDNSTQILRLSPAGRMWLILCRYDLSPDQSVPEGIEPRIVSNVTGRVMALSFDKRRGRVLTGREKEIRHMIKEGRLSKQIAASLGISVHTVNRHRQNILDKLSVGNSVEAIMAATAMKLI